MTRISRGLALTSLSLALAACGSVKYYTLPVDAQKASQTQTMIGACASEYGLESYNGDNGIVSVKYDPTASLYYHYDGADNISMQIMVDDKQVPGSELETKFAAVKSKGDDIYACAQHKLNPPPAPVAAAPAPAPAVEATSAQSGMSFEMKADASTGVSVSMKTTTTASTTTTATASASASASESASASVGMHGVCAQAVECYAELAKTVCEGASDCSFKAEVSGNDESSCRDALHKVPELIQPFTMFRPGLSAPAVCKAE
jgi:hypothetical protein